jgi:hypothetical protein
METVFILVLIAYLFFRLGRSFEKSFGKRNIANNQADNCQDGIDNKLPMLTPEDSRKVKRNL